jgi:hypothetical protein
MIRFSSFVVRWNLPLSFTREHSIESSRNLGSGRDFSKVKNKYKCAEREDERERISTSNTT